MLLKPSRNLEKPCNPYPYAPIPMKTRQPPYATPKPKPQTLTPQNPKLKNYGTPYGNLWEPLKEPGTGGTERLNLTSAMARGFRPRTAPEGDLVLRLREPASDLGVKGLGFRV